MSMPPTPKKPTRFQLHCQTWAKGCGDAECSRANRVVLCRATAMPCDIVFVGEAPGESENVVGKPFVGPAGKLLDHIVKLSVPSHLSVGFTNLVGCIPRDEDGGKATEPSFDQIQNCRPRVEDFLAVANPKLIVAVGKHAKDALTPGMMHSHRLPEGSYVISIVHPAYILRSPHAGQGLEVQRCVIDIRDAVDRVFNTPDTPSSGEPATSTPPAPSPQRNDAPAPDSKVPSTFAKRFPKATAKAQEQPKFVPPTIRTAVKQCPECNAPLRDSLSGVTCSNGHGGIVSREAFYYPFKPPKPHVPKRMPNRAPPNNEQPPPFDWDDPNIPF